MELEPRHRRGGEAARRRNADQLREPARDRIALERADDARRDHEDRGDGGERELEPGVEHGVRVPREEHRCADEERLPTVALPRREPCDSAERGGDRGANDGRVEPHRERVRRDRGERGDFGGDPAESDEKRDRDNRECDRRDLEAVDRQTVVQAGCAEVREQRLADEVRASQDDRLDDVPPLAAQTANAVARKPPLDVVADPVDPAAPAHDAPRSLRAEDGMDPLPPQPRRLVEPVRRPGRCAQLREHRYIGTLRG